VAAFAAIGHSGEPLATSAAATAMRIGHRLRVMHVLKENLTPVPFGGSPANVMSEETAAAVNA
jgi:hypothetical protein